MNVKKIILGFFIAIAVITIIALGLRPSFFQSFLINTVNKNWVIPQGWALSVENMSGHLLKSFSVENIRLSKDNGSEFQFGDITFNFDLSSLLVGEMAFDQVFIHNPRLKIKSDKTKNDLTEKSITIKPAPILIHHLTLDGKAHISINDYRDTVKINMNAQLGYSDRGTHLTVHELNVIESNILGFPIGLSNTKIDLSQGKINLVDLHGYAGFIPLEGNAIWDPSIPAFDGSFQVDSLVIPEKIFQKTPLNPEFSTLNASVNIFSDIKKTKGKLTVSNDRGLNMTGDLYLSNYNGNWKMEELSLFDGSSQLNATGGLQNDGRIYAQFMLEQLDMNQWLTNIPKTNITGLAFWDGELVDGTLNNVSLSTEVVETELYEKKDISFHGTVSLHDSLLVSEDPVNISIGNGSLSVHGRGDFKSRSLDVAVELANADVSLINNFWPNAFDSGIATGTMKIRGPFDEPSVVSDLEFLNVKYGDFILEDLAMRAEFDNRRKISNGVLSLNFGKGIWRNEHFENGTLDISIINNVFILDNCHFQNGDDFLQISGSRNSEIQYTLERVQMSLYGHYLVNTRPLVINIKDSKAHFQPFELHIDDGILEGVMSIGGEVDGHVKMSNFDAEIISLFIKDHRWKASGLVFGEVGFLYGQDKRDLDIDISLKKGTYLNEPFEHMNLTFFMKDGFLHADEISLTGKNNHGFQLNGILPISKNVDKRAPISLNTTFTSLNMELVNRFIPNFFDVGGYASGQIYMDGTSIRSPFHFEMNISEARFEKIDLGHTYGKGSFNGEIVVFDSLSSQQKFDQINAYGSIPIDLNYGSPFLGHFFPLKAFNFHSVADLGTMDFLSVYLADVDSIRGDIKLKLSITGTESDLMRSGEISIQDGSIYTLLLKDPVTQISFFGKMRENLLSIESFDGSSVKDEPNNSYKTNLSVSGQVDFKSFFEPKYALNTKGSNVYFETLPYDIEGLGNIDVNIRGKDTISIAGTIEVLEGKVFQEFVFADIGDAESNLEDEILMDYKLNFPIKGEVTFQNSQIDALVTGELSLSQFAEYDIDFGGEVSVVEGSFFYYRDEFKGLKGQVQFDDKGFNPFLDLSAYRMIDDERIDIHLGGLLDDIDLTLISSSGYSESDILELLTWGKRFEDQEFTYNEFGNQAYSLLGSILEGQLEKNLKEMSGVSKLGIVDDIDISGAAGLINPSAQEDFEVTAKRKLSDKTSLNVSYRRSFSLSSPNQSKVGLEYKLNRNFSVVGNMDEEGKFHLKYRYRYAY